MNNKIEVENIWQNVSGFGEYNRIDELIKKV